MSATVTTQPTAIAAPRTTIVRSRKRALTKAVITVLVGVTLLVCAYLSQHSTTAVCAGQKMRPGDACLMSNGSRSSYKKMLEAEHHRALMFGAIGALLAIGGVREVVSAARRREV